MLFWIYEVQSTDACVRISAVEKRRYSSEGQMKMAALFSHMMNIVNEHRNSRYTELVLTFRFMVTLLETLCDRLWLCLLEFEESQLKICRLPPTQAAKSGTFFLTEGKLFKLYLVSNGSFDDTLRHYFVCMWCLTVLVEPLKLTVTQVLLQTSHMS